MERNLAIETIKNLMASNNLSFSDIGGSEKSPISFTEMKRMLVLSLENMEDNYDSEYYRGFLKEELEIERKEAQILGIELPETYKVVEVYCEMTIGKHLQVVVPEGYDVWEIEQYVDNNNDLIESVKESPDDCSTNIEVNSEIDNGCIDDLCEDYDNDVSDFE